MRFIGLSPRNDIVRAEGMACVAVFGSCAARRAGSVETLRVGGDLRVPVGDGLIEVSCLPSQQNSSLY